MYRHHSHRFLDGNHYCNWCGCAPERADIPCDYKLIATDPNWKPSDFVLAEYEAKKVQRVVRPRTKEDVTHERKLLRERLQRMLNRTVARMKALELDEVKE